MHIEVQANPNCQATEEFVFNELSPPAKISGIKISEEGQDALCDVVGVEPDGCFVDAFAAKITDSGSGFAYMIFGGAWGVRMRPRAYSHEAWDLSNTRQWGEPFKIYGSEEDIIYA